MATLSDLRAALAQVVGAALYPAGVPEGSNPPSVAGCPIRIYQGRPEREALDADLAAGIVNVSVFILGGGYNTSRYPVVDTVLSIPATTLSWSVSGTSATLTGTVSSPQNVGLVVDGAAFIYAVQPTDALASIANYLKALGWNGALTWGRPAKLPKHFDTGLLDGKTLKPLSAWAALGVRAGDGAALPKTEIEAGLVQPGGEAGPTLLTYGNYRAIMKWNHSLYFATAISYLADRFES